LNEVRDKAYRREHQEEDPGAQTMRVRDDTAIVTARLWAKGVSHDTSFDASLWFSDTDVLTTKRWRYIFGKASLHLSSETVKP
jgi:hypothetical protein